MKNRWKPKPAYHFTLEEPNPQTGVSVFFEESYRLVTMGKLLEKFYHHNHWDTFPSPPISTKLVNDRDIKNPEKEDGWWLMYYGGFHVLVEQHYNSHFGPHVAKLRYKSSAVPRIYWIATLQLPCFFFNEETILANIFVAIRDRKFYQNPAESDKQVVL